MMLAFSLVTHAAKSTSVPGVPGGGVLTIFHPGWLPLVMLMGLLMLHETTCRLKGTLRSLPSRLDEQDP